MKCKRLILTLLAPVVLSLLCAIPSRGQAGPPMGAMMGNDLDNTAPLDPSIKRSFVPLGGGSAGALYEPVAPGEKSHIGIYVTHGGISYMTFNACFELAKRGYRVFCVAVGGGEAALTGTRRAVEYLRKYPGIEKVVLFGHSGGSTTMSAYQTVAENGLKACQGPEKIYKCSNNLAGMPPADGVVLADANWGDAEMTFFSLDPAVLSRGNGIKVNPDLDLYNPKNGFNANGNSDYSPEFIKKFQSAQVKLNNELLKAAQDRLALIQAGQGNFADDEPFTVAGAGPMNPNNKLFAEDVKLMSHTQKAWPLIHPDGSVTTEIVHTVRVPESPKTFTPFLNMGASNTTIKGWLQRALRVSDDYGFDEDSVHGIDWTSSLQSTPGNIEGVHVPSLFMGMTGHFEYLAAETIYAHSPASDKSLAFVEGASHMYSTCKKCETTPGQYGDTIKTLFDYVDKWLSQKGRFIGVEKQ